MARIAGRNGRLYAAIASGGSAEPIAFVNKFNVNFSVNDYDVTAFGDSGQVFVAGLPSCEGNYAGFYDTATAQLYTAATDGVARKFYFYWDTNDLTKYLFGTAIFDMNIEQGVDQSVNISGNFKAASPFIKV